MDSATLGYYSYVVVPPIQRVLNILLATMSIGGCRPPLIRELAEQAEVARGAVTDLLRQLATDGWILYDGRTITLMRDRVEAPDDLIDHMIDQDGDSEESAVYCTAMLETTDRDSDRSRDRSESPPAPPMVFNITTAPAVVDLEASTTGGSGGIFSDDRSADHPPPAAQLMAELGANPKIIRDAYAARGDWTPSQVRARWEYDQKRIANSDGKQTEGIFFTALRSGELAPPRPDPQRPLDPLSYADDPAFRLGSDPPDESARRNALYRDAHWRAVDLLGPGAAYGDMAIVVEALVDGATDEQALAELAQHGGAP